MQRGNFADKTLVFVDLDRLERIGSRRPIRVGLGPEFLAATSIALVPFEEVRRRLEMLSGVHPQEKGRNDGVYQK